MTLPPAELLALRRTAAAGALVLVAEDEPALLEIVGRHLDRHAVAGERLDPVLLHLARRVGDDGLPGVELHAKARVGQNLGDQTFELDQFFLGHGFLCSLLRLNVAAARRLASRLNRTLHEADAG